MLVKLKSKGESDIVINDEDVVAMVENVEGKTSVFLRGEDDSLTINDNVNSVFKRLTKEVF